MAFHTEFAECLQQTHAVNGAGCAGNADNNARPRGFLGFSVSHAGGLQALLFARKRKGNRDDFWMTENPFGDLISVPSNREE
jgi:hypothetical protein